jgi:hypothetical protein
MLLTIDNQPREFVSLRTFREAHGLPAAFGMTLFKSKNYEGLGRIDGSGTELQAVRDAMLDAMPQTQPKEGWFGLTMALQLLFRRKLIEVNEQIGLKHSEIDYAVNGLGEVCQAIIYGAISAILKGQPPPAFEDVYNRWLSSTVLLSRVLYRYPHRGEVWQIQPVQNAYGRVGMVVHTPSATHYVHDTRLSCPAEGFMVSLLHEMAARLTPLISVETNIGYS